MARLAQFVSLTLALGALPATLAGPACAKKNYKLADCVSKCNTKWGWTGAMMNTDPWGSIIKKTDTVQNWDAIIAEACGVTVASTTVSGAASTASTVPVIPSAAAAAGAKPTLQSSSLSSTSTLVTTSSVSSSSVSPLLTSTSISSSSIKATSSSTSSKASVTPSAVAPAQTQGFLASTRSRLVTSTIVRPTTSVTPVKPTTTPAPVKTTSSARQPEPTTAKVESSVPAAEAATGGTSNSDIQAYLQAHNSIRSQHGASPLTWSDNLASKAQQWANGCQFKHSGGSLGPFGENLAAGTGSSYGIAAAVKSWTDEVSQYNPSNPVPSHFTQVVWKGTSQVGCAVQSCGGIFAASFGPAKFFVCEYSAQGNVIGQFAQNVQV